MKKVLKVLPVEGRLQPDFESFDAGVRRFVGRKFDEKLGKKDKDGVPQGEFVITGKVVVLPYRAEYVQAVKEGDLIPVDAETARLCKVSL